jgi:hypothetical protein
MPVEEIAPSLAGAGAGLLLARAWLMLHVRRRREPAERPAEQPVGADDVGRVGL